MTPTLEQAQALGAKLSKADKKILRDLLDYAASIAVHKTKLDPSWPMWQKKDFWKEYDPAVQELQARCKAVTGHHCTL
jgi:hypothetical protein